MNSKHSYFYDTDLFFLELSKVKKNNLVSYQKVLRFHFCLVGLQPISTADRHSLFAGFDLSTRLSRHLGNGA